MKGRELRGVPTMRIGKKAVQENHRKKKCTKVEEHGTKPARRKEKRPPRWGAITPRERGGQGEASTEGNRWKLRVGNGRCDEGKRRVFG